MLLWVSTNCYKKKKPNHYGWALSTINFKFLGYLLILEEIITTIFYSPKEQKDHLFSLIPKILFQKYY